MIRNIPGLIVVEGREFFYIETTEGDEFFQLLDKAFTSCKDMPMPQDGGVIEEKAHIVLEDGKSLLAISYKGDLEGWRRILTSYCETDGRKWGIASNQKLLLSDGTELDLGSCNIVFDE